MRAEDLFEAMEGIDEDLIARSDRKRKSAQGASSAAGKNGKNGKRRSRRKKTASLYRYAVVALASAAAVFMVLMVRDFVTPSYSENAAQSTRAIAGMSGQADESARDSGDMMQESEEPAAEAGEETDMPEDEAQQEAAEAVDSSEQEASGDTGEKTAVDLLGDLKGDYVSLEYISAEDERDGAARKVPEYSEEGEKALTDALENGEPIPEVMAKKGEPVYYVYLTEKSGKVDKITFYEKNYISMESIPGMVMKIKEDDYAEIMTLFE